jgi:hypothetical protein
MRSYKERVPKRPRTDSTSTCAFHPDLLAEVWSDIVDGAASYPVSDSGLTVAIGVAFCTCGGRYSSKGVDSDDPESDRTGASKAKGPGSSLGRSD